MMKNQRGYANILFLFFFILAIPLLSIVTDLAFAKAIKVKAWHDLNLACRAASNQLDMDALTDAESPRVIILPDDAWIAYNRILQANMRLDTSNVPLSGSVSSGTVQTLDFTVINLDSLPYTYSRGTYTELIERPSVTATITFPVRSSALLKYALKIDHYDISVHSTVGPEIRPQL